MKWAIITVENRQTKRILILFCIVVNWKLNSSYKLKAVRRKQVISSEILLTSYWFEHWIIFQCQEALSNCGDIWLFTTSILYFSAKTPLKTKLVQRISLFFIFDICLSNFSGKFKIWYANLPLQCALSSFLPDWEVVSLEIVLNCKYLLLFYFRLDWRTWKWRSG